jgi:hypothetical protein
MKVKITEPGWAGYTGPLGMSEFVNGVSVDHVSESEALRLGSIMSIHALDKDGNEIEQVSPGIEWNRVRTMSAPVVAPVPTDAELAKTAAAATALKSAEDAELEAMIAAEEAEKKAAAEAAALAATNGNADEKKIETAKVWTREELEVVADAKGIAGLREIADPLNVKSNAIPSLIDKIIQAQSPEPTIPGVAGP